MAAKSAFIVSSRRITIPKIVLQDQFVLPRQQRCLYMHVRVDLLQMYSCMKKLMGCLIAIPQEKKTIAMPAYIVGQQTQASCKWSAWPNRKKKIFHFIDIQALSDFYVSCTKLLLGCCMHNTPQIHL